MAIELTMPALSPTMEKGTLAKWLVVEGDAVKAGDCIAEIETDKATMEYEAMDEGIVARLLIAEGTDEVAVGTVIALLAEPGDASSARLPEAVAPASAEAPPILAPAELKHAFAPTAPAPVADALLQPRRTPPADRIKISPLAQRIADKKGIDLALITGSGVNGRIVRADLGLAPAAMVPPAAVGAAPAAPACAPPPAGVPVETIKLSSMGRTIARRLTESKTSVPHFYLTARCNLDPLLALRAELNAALAPRGVKLSVNDMLIKALALALHHVPDANVQFGGDVLHRFARADIAMAVAIDGGLVTPVIRDAGNMSLSAIAGASRTLVQKARDGKLTPQDYDGGTASISNLGMFGIDEMVPVINPPQALILGIGAGIEQPWKVDGQLGLATVMAATGSFDHRAIKGATAAEFMSALREAVETPMLLCH
ncbi:pyruvate dehydrogenase E2 component (dihydrolipoamide acetyltransferase) [Sphingopyxis panaciterrae]|uniref:dihydrolipoamide acetyltransferase family protein n=1 Tax=Sphingopyxis panaciterrae TaxID=363841 RepID=UPI001421942A|nr:dihydrolipoamide acetyltransferase family protein [Sphingopyxis panaciterrae]NIJ37480.1 pyruvate dehydrogenase E2 component (dihydrolipoamide acetyltransferase) [Sphingopyxis panaciterrae]